MVNDQGVVVERDVESWRTAFSEQDRAVYDLYRRQGRSATNWEAAALLIVDVTEAFIGPRLPTVKAAREVRTACGIPGWSALPRIARLLAAFRAAGRPIIFAKPLWSGEAYLGGTTTGAVRDTREDPIPQEIAPIDNELVLPKSKASAFFGTPLPSFFVRQHLSSVVIAGSTTSGCVRSTAVDASSYGLDVIVASDSCFDRAQLSHDVALYELDVKYATVMLTDDVVDELDRRVDPAARRR